MSTNVCVVGSRGMADYGVLSHVLDGLILRDDGLQFVCGGARGADTLGERWAKDHGVPTVLMPADWATHGKKAGPIRNTEMAQITDVLVAFWDGHSRGTQHMLRTCHTMATRSISIYLYRLDGSLWWQSPIDGDIEPPDGDGYELTTQGILNLRGGVL